MPSKTIVVHWQRAKDIHQSAAELAAPIDAACQEALRPFLAPGENLPDLLVLQQLVGRFAGSVGDKLNVQDDRYSAALLRDLELRQQRDQLAEAVGKALFEAKRLFRQAFGRGKGAALGEFGSHLSVKNPSHLVRAGRQVIELLRGPGFVFPTGSALVVPDPLDYASRLERPIGQLEAILAQLEPGKRGTQLVQGHRAGELEHARDRLQRAADFLYGLYRLAGEDFHADRVARPLRRKKPEKADKSPPGTTPAAPPVQTPPVPPVVAVV